MDIRTSLPCTAGPFLVTIGELGFKSRYFFYLCNIWFNRRGFRQPALPAESGLRDREHEVWEFPSFSKAEMAA